MARYRHCNYDQQKLLPMSCARKIRPGNRFLKTDS